MGAHDIFRIPRGTLVHQPQLASSADQGAVVRSRWEDFPTIATLVRLAHINGFIFLRLDL
jgi:hypothetical protein